LPSTLDAESSTDVGQHVDADYAEDGTLHVAYVDAIGQRLLHRAVSAGGTPGMVEIVDSGSRPDGPHPVGASASVDARGAAPSILYQDQGTADLEWATRAAGWTHAPLEQGPQGLGFSSHQVSEGAARYYTSWVFDRSTTPLGKLLLARMP
jgi:hypothetical protein